MKSSLHKIPWQKSVSICQRLSERLSNTVGNDIFKILIFIILQTNIISIENTFITIYFGWLSMFFLSVWFYLNYSKCYKIYDKLESSQGMIYTLEKKVI